MMDITLAELVAIVLDPVSSVESKTLAISVAYRTGKRDQQLEVLSQAVADLTHAKEQRP